MANAPHGSALDQSALRAALRDAAALKHSSGREVVVEGMVRAYATGSVQLEIHPDAAASSGAQGSSEEDCIDLALPPRLFQRMEGGGLARIKGRLQAIDGLSELGVTSLKHAGIKFYPDCRYGEQVYAFIVVEEITRL